MKIIKIHTDGACAGNQNAQNIGGWGAVLEYQGTTKELFGGMKNTTNNRMEMTALIEALKALKTKDVQIEIYSDSAYVINCFQQGWHNKWRVNGWINSKKEPVENKDLWQELLALIESFPKIAYYSIKGHLDLSKPAEVSKWYMKFVEKNKLRISQEEFQAIVRMNHLADDLANQGIAAVKSGN
jgi:ribonuclease HI